MADVNDLLGQALNTPVAPAPVVPSTAILPALSEDKKASITAASADKMAQLATATPYQMAAGGDRGTNSMSQYEQDMRYSSPSELYAKYGTDAARMIQDRATGILDVKQDLSPSNRSASALTYDTLSSGLSSLTNALGGVAAFGTGLVNKEAGTNIAQGLSDLTKWTQETQSPELQGHTRALEAKNFLDARDSQVLADNEVSSGGSELIASLKREGRNVISSISNATEDPATLLNGVSQAVGSLFAVGPLSKVIGSAGGALSNSTKAGLALQAELGGASGVASRLALAAGEAAPVVGAIGAIEGGGAYQQVAADVMSRSHDTLMKDSPMYRGLIADGMSQDEAKTTVANRTGLLSGAITAPLAAATGTLVSKFEGSPFAAKSLQQVVGNILKEPIEEGIQGGTSQLAQNYAETQTSNQNKDLADGVGRQIGEGALYGLGMTGLVQAPIGAGRALQAVSPFAKIAADRAKAMASNAGQAITARADALEAANRAASPVADATVLKAANEATQTAPDAQATVQSAVDALPVDTKPAAQSYVDKVMSAIKFNVDEVPPSLVPVLDGSTNRVEAIQRLAEQVKAAKTPEEQLRAGLNMYDMLSPLANVIDSDPAAIDAIPADHPASKIIQEYDAMVAAAMNTPSVRDAMSAIAQLRSQEAAPVDLANPESVRDAVLTAEHLPDRANLDNNEKILYQVEQGNLTVTPQQKAALQASTALLRAAKAADEEAARLGNNTKSAQVARNIRSENGEKGPSALQHTQGIMAAWKAGNTDLATERLIAFQKLAENMSNKVGALNAHLAGGDSTAPAITYQALAPNGDWFESKTGLSINPVKTRSVEFAQTVAGEAKLLADIYNGLTEAFPDLGGKHFDVTSLDSKLDLPVSEVVKNFSSAPVKTPAPAAESTVAINPAPVVVPVKTELVSAQPSPEPVKVETTSAPKVQEIPSYTKKVWNMVVVYDAFDGMEKGDWKVFNNGFDDTFAFNYLTPAGIKIAGDFQLDGRQFLHFNITSDTGKAINSPAVLREVVKKLSERFPKVTKLHGFRISGTKGKNPETIEVVYTIKDGKVLLDRPAKATTVQEKPEPMVKAAPPVNDKPKAAKAEVLYPDLSTPLFNETFKIPAEQRTHIIGTEEPVNFVANVFKSQSSFVQLVGSLNYNFDAPLAKAYQAYVNTAYDLTDIMQRNLTSFMNEKGIADMGTEAGRIIRGKALNIAEEVNGEMVYNPELVQVAALAGLQWNLTADNFGSTLDEKDLASMLGVDAESVSSAQVELMNQGLSVTEAKRTLAQKIRNYWGVTPDANAQLGNVEGIPESVAAELMRAMVETGDLTVLQLAYLNDGTLVQYDGKKPEGTIKTFDRVIPRERGEEDLLNTFPSAIEQAVLKTPEDVAYIGTNVKIPVAQKQLRSPLVDNTDQQLAAIENEQSTEYRLNLPIVAFYQGLGENALVWLFGAGNLDPDNMNINHAQSAEGQNRSTLSAFKHLNNLIGEMSNRAESLPLDQIPVRFAHNITRVGRLQMLGKYNPQASKMVREALLPTWSTLDLSDKSGPDYTRFMLGVAQALGVKIHNMPAAESIKKAEAMLNGPLKEVIQDLSGWVKDFDASSLGKAQTSIPAGIADKLSQGFGNDLSFASLHAAMEYARLQNVDGKDFRTAVYVEADGMTNGPINAMALFTAGPFSPEWITNMGKGGLWFNRPGENSTTYRYTTDSKDLYQATTDVLKARMADLRAELVNNDPVNTKLNDLTNLMDLFLGGDLTLDTDGNLILNRGIAKNPLTITIYGSGAGGIAAKMVKAMVDKIYEAMSQVVDKKATSFPDIALAMFGAPQSVANQKMERFVAAYSSLSNSRISKTTKGLKVQPNPAGRKAGNFDPKTFTFRSEEIKNMQSNMLHLFVTPMRSAIEETVGKPLMDTAQLLRASTQVQSIFLETMFRQEVEAMMAEKEKSDPKWKKGDFLTQKELSSIYKKLDALAPFVKTGTQTFFVAGSQSTDLGLTQFGRDFAGKFRSDAFVYGPADSGVAGIPFLNIGAGDAQMMQTAATMVDAPQRNLKIFDGMNMPLDRIYEDSEKMNQAVWESWMGNPLDAVKESYDQFMDNANFDMIADAKEALVKALFPPIVWNEDVPVDVIRTAMDTLQTKLTQSVDEIQARHNVMAMVDVSVDQMAATASPYGRKGTVQLTGTDPESIAVQLNTLYVQELAKIQQAKPSEAISTEIAALATTHDTGVKLLNSSDLNQLAQVSNMPADQAEVLKSITQSLAADGYLVAFGSAAEIAAFQQEVGFVAPSNVPAGIISGYTSFGDKVIYLINPTTETLIHELVHAATFDFVNSFYNGDAGRLNPQAAAAIERTEVLMEQFLNLSAADILPAAAQAHDNASAVINDYLLNGDKASALNEFMAWALSNRQLQNLTKKTKASKLAQIAQSVWEAIKSMYFRRREAPNKGTDMFSNLLFNSAMLMRKQATTAQRYKGNVLFMNSVYGDNERLANVAETFDKTVAQYLQAPIRSGTLTSAPVVATATMNAIDMANLVQAHGFVMNMQEASTFNSIVAALATEAQIDPASMVVAQELYSHVIQNLSVESFMADPTDQTQRYYAQEKYNAVSGKYGTRTDALGRTAMLPTFLALATVNNEFRKILSEMDMPKSLKNADGTLDAALENVGSGLMDKLSAHLSGTSKAKNVQEAIDALHDNIASIVNDRDTFIDQVASKSGGLVDRANEVVVVGITALANATNKTANKVAQNANNKVVRTTAELTAAIAGLVADRSGEIAAKGLMTKANKSKLWEPMHTFINDLVGRTDSNASIYDMIKGTRSIVQAARQQFRERLPELLAEKFNRTITPEEWETLHTGLGKTDIAALLDANTNAEVIELLSDQTKLSAEVARLEGELAKADPTNFPLVQMKAKQLANFMNTGEPGRNLLRNAEAVSKMFGEPVRNFTAKSQDYIHQLDQLISLYSVDSLPKGTKESLASLVQDQPEGTDFSMSYLKGQRYDEQAKATGVGRINFYKGHLPTQGKEGVSLIVADDADYADLRAKSYVRVEDYNNSNLDRGTKMGYYFAPVSARAAFQQGIMQNVRQTAGGVDQATGFSTMMTAGRITDTGAVKAITARLKYEKGGSPLLPVYDENGRVFAYERSIDPVQLKRTQDVNHLGKAIGQWRGRQFEEGIANVFNMSLVDKMHDMYEKDLAESTFNSKQYVDLFNDKLDPVIRDAVKLFNPETVAYIESKFGKSFPVRRDMLNDSLGYRNASIGDAWSGNTRWSEETQKTVKRMAMSVFGNDAYKTLVNAEQTLRNIVSDARVLIAVKSVIVPAVNFVSNILQLTARGVPLKDMYKNMPTKTAELESYMTNRLKQVDLEAELRATQDPRKTLKLTNQVNAINDANKRLSIWPLLEAGEFSTVADAGLTREEMMLSTGRLQAYMEQAANKLPGPFRTLGRYALVTKDTALFKALQKSVEYSDFLAKAVYFDDLTKRQGLTNKEALGRVTEEFINYDRLPGRFRGTMEQLGLLWFYNFKIRSTKVALSMMRNNPVHTLLASTLPAVVPGLTTFGAPGLPIYDNIAWKAITGTLGGSIGPGQGLRAASLNPWVNLTQ